jgi:hypothetical protein
LQLRIGPAAVQNLQGHIIEQDVEKVGPRFGFFEGLLTELV